MSTVLFILLTLAGSAIILYLVNSTKVRPAPLLMYWASVQHEPPSPVVHQVYVTDAGDRWKLLSSSPDALPNGEKYIMKDPPAIWETSNAALYALSTDLQRKYSKMIITMQELEDMISSVKAVLP